MRPDQLVPEGKMNNFTWWLCLKVRKDFRNHAAQRVYYNFCFTRNAKKPKGSHRVRSRVWWKAGPLLPGPWGCQAAASETPSALRGAGRRRRSWEVATGGPETSPTAPRRVSPMQSTQGRACWPNSVDTKARFCLAGLDSGNHHGPALW